MSGFRAGHHLFVILNADENPQITQTTQIKEKQEAGAVGRRGAAAVGSGIGMGDRRESTLKPEAPKPTAPGVFVMLPVSASLESA